MDLQSYVTSFVYFVNEIVIPFLLAMALFIFIFNVIRYFVIGGSNDDSKEKAKSLAVYGVLAFVVILIFWGVVNLLSSSLGLTSNRLTSAPCFDYDPSCNAAPSGMFTTGGTSGIGGEGVGVGGSFGGPSLPGSGSGVNVPDFSSDPGSPTTGSPAAPSLPTQDTPPFSEGIPSEITESLEAAENAELVVWAGTIALDAFAEEYYDWRIIPIVTDATNAVNDSSTPIEERAVAAIRLEQIGALGEGEIGEERLAEYIGTLQAEATANNQTSLDMVSLRKAASEHPQALTNQIEFTQNSLYPLLVESNRGFWDWGEASAEAQAAASNQLAALYDPSLTDEERVAFFNVLANGPSMPDSEIYGIRERFVEEIDAERFFRGELPLYGPQSPEAESTSIAAPMN